MTPSQRIIEKLGGIRPAAEKLGRAASTVQNWYESGFIPARNQQSVLDRARELGIEIGPADFFEDAA